MFGRLWKRREDQDQPTHFGHLGHPPPVPRAHTVAAVPPMPAAAPKGKLFTFDAIGETVVVTIVEHDLTANKVADLGFELKDLLARHEKVKNLVLDLQNVDYLDSAALNMLIVLMKAVREAGGNIAIASAKRSIEVLFKLTRLDRLFCVQRDVLDAVAAVEQRPEAA